MRGPDWHLVADDMIIYRFELLRFVLETCEYDFWTDELLFGYFDCVCDSVCCSDCCLLFEIRFFIRWEFVISLF